MARRQTIRCLADLVRPHTPEVFLRRYWERKALFLPSKGSRDLSDILCPSDLDFLLAKASRFEPQHVELWRSEEARYSQLPPSASSVEVARRAWNDGCTIRIAAAQRHWPALWELTRTLEDELGFSVNANIYSSPPRAKGLPRHYDGHDVFALQIAGDKEWTLFDRPIEHFIEHVPPLRNESAQDALNFRVQPQQTQASKVDCKPIKKFRMRSGDVVYIPRGVAHEAGTSESPSLHVTFGVLSFTYVDLFAAALADVALLDARFRESLPPGYSTHRKLGGVERKKFAALIEAFKREANVEKAEAAAAQVFSRSRDELSASFASQWPTALENVREVERRPGIDLRLVEKSGALSLKWSGRTYHAPREYEAALRFVMRHERFKVGAIAGLRSKQEKETFVATLIAEGVLRAT